MSNMLLLVTNSLPRVRDVSHDNISLYMIRRLSRFQTLYYAFFYC